MSEDSPRLRRSESPLIKVIRPIFEGIYALRSREGREVAAVFHALPDRRLTDYYKVIKRPFSLFLIKNKLNAGKYRTMAEFIYDVAQITYNARVFNRKDSFIYEDALTLDTYLRDQMDILRQTGKFPPRELRYPTIGKLPESSDVEDHGMGSEEDFDDDDMDEDDLDGTPPPSKGGRRGAAAGTTASAPGSGPGRPRRAVSLTIPLPGRKRRATTGGQVGSLVDEDMDMDRGMVSPSDDRRKRRGRPPTVDRPHEHRIKAIMRAIRREKDENGRLLFLEFEKLPDARVYPEYYTIITQPMAMDHIRKNIKRRSYQSVEEFLNDMKLVFDNAKTFNADHSQIYADAAALEQVMAASAEEEMRKPDSEYMDMVSSNNSKLSRMPLDEIEHRGETYRVGDWVHLSNLNDPAKPTIAQIFRIWKADNKNWVNVCWYYRPEQTVHRYDKLFYEHEVVKSGQYRDHLVDEILEKCFVMFFTKYQRGRPLGIGDKQIYCCESRYNENEKTFNKIRTWKACIPDEIRSVDYPMDLYAAPLTLRRIVSPIRHLLPDNAKEDDPIPAPKMGVPNAPPIVGAVYRRPYDPNDPPEMPTPLDAALDYAAPSTPGAVVGSGLATPRITSTVGGRRLTQMSGVGRSSHRLVSPAYGNNQSYGSATSKTAVPPPYPIISPAHVAPGGPTAFTIDVETQRQLEDRDIQATINLDDVMVWFPAPPLNVTSRFEPPDVRSALDFSQTEKSTARFGHSAKYLAWKRSQVQVN